MTKSLDQKKEIKANLVVPHRILRWIILTKILNLELNGIKMRVFFEKNIKKKKHVCLAYKNYYYICKSNVSPRNMIKVSKNMSL